MVICPLRSCAAAREAMLTQLARSGTNAAVSTAFLWLAAPPQSRIRVLRNTSADAVAAPQESSKTKAMPQSRDEPRKLLGNNRLPKLVVALGRFASPGNGCFAWRQPRAAPLWTSAPAAPTVGQPSGSLQALQRPQTGQLRPAHKRQPRGLEGAAPVRRTRPLILRQPKPH